VWRNDPSDNVAQITILARITAAAELT